MGLQLAIYEGNRVARRVPVTDQLLIGRNPDCSLHLTDGSVSGRHARIFREGKAFSIEDLGSHNKTVIEGVATLTKGQRAELRAGMVLLLGRIRLAVEVDPADGPPSSTQADLERTAQEGPELELTLRPPAAPSSPEESGAAMTVVPSVKRPEPARPPSQGSKPQSDSHTLVPDAPNEALSAHAFLEDLKPMLVVDNDAYRKLVRITAQRFNIGRTVGELQINHPMLSNPHAQIFYQAKFNRLYVEDKMSKNSTALNGEVLVANRPRELPLQSHLRLGGTIDALFLMAKGYEGETLDERRKLAIEMLVRSKKLDAGRRRKAEEEAKQQGIPLEAALILASALTVPSWVQALEEARIRLLVPDNTRSLKLWIGVLLVAVLALLALFLLER